MCVVIPLVKSMSIVPRSSGHGLVEVKAKTQDGQIQFTHEYASTWDAIFDAIEHIRDLKKLTVKRVKYAK